MARVRYGTPLWFDRVPASRRPAYPRYKGLADTDVVVVGGGLAGCMVATTFRRAGIHVVVLEAGRVGEQSAASLGWVPAHPGVPFRALQEAHGLRAARKIWDASRRGALEAAALLRRLRIRCDLERADSVVAAAGGEELKQLKREHQALADAGMEGTWAAARRVAVDLHAERLDGALVTKSDALCDPYRACLGLAASAIKAGAAIHEQSPVVKVRAGRKQVEVSTAAGTLTARTVIMATGDPGPGCGALGRHTRAMDTYFVATPPLPPALARGLSPSDAVLRDIADPPHTLRHTKDGRLLFQGGDQKASGRGRANAPGKAKATLPGKVPDKVPDKIVVQRTGQLMYELSRLYPVISGMPPEYGWSARSVTAADGLLLAGPHRNFPRHLFAIGLGATGVTGAYLAARILLRHYQDAPEAADELFGFSRVQPIRG